jgi:hypothetical protein
MDTLAGHATASDMPVPPTQTKRKKILFFLRASPSGYISNTNRARPWIRARAFGVAIFGHKKAPPPD